MTSLFTTPVIPGRTWPGTSDAMTVAAPASTGSPGQRNAGPPCDWRTRFAPFRSCYEPQIAYETMDRLPLPAVVTIAVAIQPVPPAFGAETAIAPLAPEP